MQHLSGYFLSLKFDPELLFGRQFQYRNRIAVEFNQLYHWHGLMPDSFVIQGEEYSYEQFLYNTSMLLDYGVEALVESFSKQTAGMVRSCSLQHVPRGAAGPQAQGIIRAQPQPTHNECPGCVQHSQPVPKGSRQCVRWGVLPMSSGVRLGRGSPICLIPGHWNKHQGKASSVRHPAGCSLGTGTARLTLFFAAITWMFSSK